jgi:hypothetical protein
MLPQYHVQQPSRSQSKEVAVALSCLGTREWMGWKRHFRVMKMGA